MIALRPPSEVMRLARFGAMFPTRLSFLRTLLRRLADERAELRRTLWQMDTQGHGHAVYSIPLSGHTYSLIAITQPLDPEQRTDRVIATAWDAAFVLFDGVPSADDLARVRANAPLQEAGRLSARELVLSRANKSVRLWEHVIGALRAGRQPDQDLISQTGYLMRTTAVYGNGKFGLSDRTRFAARPGMAGAFAAEMLTVWLIRHFTHDLAAHVGQARLSESAARTLGIGNATGLGMAPFLVSHPVLLHNWMAARETALARARALPFDLDRLEQFAEEAAKHLETWNVPDPAHQARIDALRLDWQRARAQLRAPRAGKDAFECVQALGLDVQELMVSLLIEAAGPEIDDLAEEMSDATGPLHAPLKDTQALRVALSQRYAWALDRSYDSPKESRRFWYVSANKLEPRIGDRFAESGAELESPLDIARRAARLLRDLPEKNTPISEFLATRPEHAFSVQRAALAMQYPYAEIQDNLIGAACRPIDLLRAKLALFGATRFDPKSDLWTRITLAQGAPLAQDIAQGGQAAWLPA